MVFEDRGRPGEGQIQRHANSHLLKGQDPLFVVGKDGIPEGGIVVWQNGVPVIQPISTVLNTYFSQAYGVFMSAGNGEGEGEIGPQGPPGNIGATGGLGPTGMMGLDGEDGDMGPPGLDGIAGTAGSAGATGATGEKGAAGQDGEDGEDGQTIPGLDGATGAAGADGTQPQSLINLFNYAFTRIRFLEEALKVNYGPNDIDVPEETTLLAEGVA